MPIIRKFVLLSLCSLAVGAFRPMPAQLTPPTARLTEDLRLDAEREDFPGVGRIFVGPRRQIIVPIQQDMQIRMYDANGKKTSTIGRRGSGPGEFQWVSSINWKSDTLVVDDPNQNRFTYVAPNGRILRTVVYPEMRSVRLPGAATTEPASSGRSFPIGMRTDGSLIVQWSVRTPNNVSYIAKVGSDGIVQAMLRMPKYNDERWYMEAFGFGDFLPFSFMPISLVSATGDRIAHATAAATSRDSGMFTISMFRANGDTMFARNYPYRGVAIPKSARDSALNEISKMPEGGKRVIDRFTEIARSKMPTIHSGLEYVVLGLDNTVWAALHAAESGQTVLVLNSRGDAVARILLPRNTRLRQASATQIWVTEKDADGLTSVVRYKVTGINCGVGGC